MTGHRTNRATGTGTDTTASGVPTGPGNHGNSLAPAGDAALNSPVGAAEDRDAATATGGATRTRRGVAEARPGPRDATSGVAVGGHVAEGGAVAAAGPSRTASRPGRGELVAAGLVAFTTLLAPAIASPALPAIERDLATVPAISRWVVLGYGLAAVVAAPFAARRAVRAATLPDRKGGPGGGSRRAAPDAGAPATAGTTRGPGGRAARSDGPGRALLLGAGGFAAATVACAVAPWIGLLLAARVVQGAFAGTLAVLVPLLAARRRHPVTALGVTAAAGSFGLLVGAAAGGGIVPVIGWRGVLLLHVPLAAAIAFLAMRSLRNKAEGGAGSPDGPASRVTGEGAEAVTPYPTGKHARGLRAVRTTAGEGGGLASAGARAAMPYQLGVRALVALLALAVADGAALVVYPFFLFQGQVQQSALPEIGLALGAAPIGLVAAAILGGRFADRRGPLFVAIAGALVTLAGMLLASPLDLGWSAVEIAARLLVVGVGMGLYGGAAQAVALLAATSADVRGGIPQAVLNGVPAQALAKAAARVQMLRYAGFVAGPLVAATLWEASGYFSRTGMGSVLLACAAAMLFAVVALIPLATRPAADPGTADPTPPPSGGTRS